MTFIRTGRVAHVRALRNAYKFIETRKRKAVCDMTASVWVGK
jgi:hypothetical protein